MSFLQPLLMTVGKRKARDQVLIQQDQVSAGAGAGLVVS